MYPDGLDVVVWFIAPHLLEDQRRRNRLAMALQQAVQQLELQVGEPHRPVEPDGLEALWHQGEAAVAEDFLLAVDQGGAITAP